MVSVMIVALVTVHLGHGLFAGTNGIEVPLLYGSFALALALIGPGEYSLDAWLGAASRWTPAMTWIVLGLGIVGGIGNLSLRRPPDMPAGALP
jgi:putative oxidoreductase